MTAQQNETHVYRHRADSVAFVSIDADGTATAAWPRIRHGYGMSDLIAQQRATTSGQEESPLTTLIRQTLPGWDREQPPLGMAHIGYTDGATMRINGRLGITLRDYFGFPLHWNGRGPDVELARTPDGCLAVFQRHPDGHAGVALRIEPDQEPAGSAADTMSRVQAGHRVDSEQTDAPDDKDATIAHLRGLEITAMLTDLSASEAHFIGLTPEPAANGPATKIATVTLYQTPDGQTDILVEGQAAPEMLERAGVRLLSIFRESPDTALDQWLAKHGMTLEIEITRSGHAHVSIRPLVQHKTHEKDGLPRYASGTAETVADAKRTLTAQLSGGVLITDVKTSGGRRQLAVPDFHGSNAG